MPTPQRLITSAVSFGEVGRSRASIHPIGPRLDVRAWTRGCGRSVAGRRRRGRGRARCHGVKIERALGKRRPLPAGDEKRQRRSDRRALEHKAPTTGAPAGSPFRIPDYDLAVHKLWRRSMTNKRRGRAAVRFQPATAPMHHWNSGGLDRIDRFLAAEHPRHVARTFGLQLCEGLDRIIGGVRREDHIVAAEQG
jgi:hypothetical protein